MNEQKLSVKTSDTTVVSLFFLVPTLLLLLGYFVVPSPQPEPFLYITYSILYLGLFFLGVGLLIKQKNTGCLCKIVGWILFSSFWATYPRHLYFSEGGDIFNAAVCIIGVYMLFYLAYHEWFSIQKKEYPFALNWIAGGTFLAGIIYFTFDLGIFPQLKTTLIEVVAAQSTMVLHLFQLPATNQGAIITYEGTAITIIFACTAIQSMVLFVGMIGALRTSMKKKLIGITITVIPIYFLNLIRNAGVIFLVGREVTSFHIAHNIIAKIGSLIALIILLFIVLKINPELYDEITGIIDLPKRKGPVERVLYRLVGKKP